MAKPTVYIETTIPSFLTARPTSNVVASARQVETIEWWENYRQDYTLYTSKFVLDEAEQGHIDAARRRMAVLKNLPLLTILPESEMLMIALIDSHALPAKAHIDAFHIAVAATNNIDYLLTWNCKHIANATMKKSIAKTCETLGFIAPTLCTPFDFLTDKKHS